MLSDKDSLRPDTDWAFQTYVVQSNFELLKLCTALMSLMVIPADLYKSMHNITYAWMYYVRTWL